MESVLILKLEKIISRPSPAAGLYRWEIVATSVTYDNSNSTPNGFYFETAEVKHTAPQFTKTKFAPLDTKELHNHVRNGFFNAQIPIIGITFPRGLDGATYSIEFGDMLGGVRISWWSSHPKAWQPLIDWYRNFVEFLNDALGI